MEPINPPNPAPTIQPDQPTPLAPNTNSRAKSTWGRVSPRARRIAVISSIALAMGLAIVVYIFYNVLKSHKAPAVFVDGKPLTEAELKKISSENISVATTDQRLTFQAPSTFKQGLSVLGAANLNDVTINGPLTVATPVTFKGDVTASASVKVNDALTAASITTSGNLQVGGNGTFAGTISATTLSVKTANITNFSFSGHLITGGSTPTASTNSGTGSGTVSVSGNDTAGTVTINAGVGAHAGDLITVTFKTAYAGTPHVTITPIGMSAAALQFYATRSTTFFTIGCINAPISGSQYVFDYLVTQ